jgi:O-antigen/teichoic acid export membrane protein
MPGLRHQRFTLALFSAYGSMLCVIAYSFLLVPLSLAHLPLGILGLWFLALQASRYMELIDLGISGASLRLMAQSHGTPADYRRIVTCSFGFQLAQGSLIAGVGFFGSDLLAQLLVTDPSLRPILSKFIFWIFVLNGVRFSLRIFPNLIRLNQTQHLLNLLSTIGVGLNLALLAYGFFQGWGIQAFLAGFVAEWGAQSFGPILIVLFHRNLTHRLQFSPPTWTHWHSLTGLGFSIFQINSFRFILESAPLVLAGRFFGPDASAIWSIATRAGSCIRDLLGQIHISAAPAFYDLMAKGERAKLSAAFTRLSTMSLSLGLLLFIAYGLWNESFVQLWTHAKCQLPPYLSFLMGIILWIQIWNAWSVEASLSLIKTKVLSTAFLWEFLFFVVAVFAFRPFGLTGIACASLLAAFLGSFPRGLRLFRDLWSSAYLGRPLIPFVGFGFAAVILVTASANACLHFLSLDIHGFVIGVFAAGTVLLSVWVIWLKPSWLKEIISGRFRFPISS